MRKRLLRIAAIARGDHADDFEDDEAALAAILRLATIDTAEATPERREGGA
jgi:hypothetical protein